MEKYFENAQVSGPDKTLKGRNLERYKQWDEATTCSSQL
jgi:hypothetical protein